MDGHTQGWAAAKDVLHVDECNYCQTCAPTHSEAQSVARSRRQRSLLEAHEPTSSLNVQPLHARSGSARLPSSSRTRRLSAASAVSRSQSIGSTHLRAKKQPQLSDSYADVLTAAGPVVPGPPAWPAPPPGALPNVHGLNAAHLIPSDHASKLLKPNCSVCWGCNTQLVEIGEETVRGGGA